MTIILCLLIAFAHAQLAPPLGQYKVDANAITLSGPSAGAHMAVQMDVAFSATFSGAGSIAGGIYRCANDDVSVATTACLSAPQQIVVADYIKEATSLAAAGAIDPTSNLAHHQFYLYASPDDTVVNMGNSDKLRQFLINYVDSSQVHTDFNTYSAHGFPTLSYGSACEIPMLPWLLNCGHDSAGLILQAMYGSLNARGKSTAAHLLKFSQAGFGTPAAGLYDYGWVYVPTACASGSQCKLHVALHGCEMNPDFIQDQFVTNAGYNEWAETNNIIVLYPQAAAISQTNPFACWDWVGLTGKDYADNKGVQMMALKKMVDSLRGM